MIACRSAPLLRPTSPRTVPRVAVVKRSSVVAKAVSAKPPAPGTLAVVTGATGYIASELIRQLVSHGWNVRATVRSIKSDKSTELTKAIEKVTAGEPGHGALDLVEADLLKDGAFDKAVKGAEYLFHLASPFVIEVADPQKELVEPAVFGTRNVLTSATKTKDTLKRVVLTSSVAAVHDCHMTQVPKAGKGARYTEEDINETSQLGGNPPEAYWVSKVEAEKEAWKISKEHGLDLVVINPNVVLGPALTVTAAEGSTSVAYLKAIASGLIPPGLYTLIDVRDVALAHIVAATNPAAKGRYIMSLEESTSSHQITDFIKKNLPEFKNIPDGTDGPVIKALDSSKVRRELGIEFTSPENTVVDTVKSLVELGIVKP